MALHDEVEERKRNDKKTSKNNGNSVKPDSKTGGRPRRTRRRVGPTVRRTN